jgi:hypothetical protein
MTVSRCRFDPAARKVDLLRIHTMLVVARGSRRETVFSDCDDAGSAFYIVSQRPFAIKSVQK